MFVVNNTHGVGFRVQDITLRVKGLGFRVKGLGLRLQASGFITCSEQKVQDVAVGRIWKFGFRLWDLG